MRTAASSPSSSNAPLLRAGGNCDELGAGIALVNERGWIELEAGTFWSANAARAALSSALAEPIAATGLSYRGSFFDFDEVFLKQNDVTRWLFTRGSAGSDFPHLQQKEARTLALSPVWHLREARPKSEGQQFLATDTVPIYV